MAFLVLGAACWPLIGSCPLATQIPCSSELIWAWNLGVSSFKPESFSFIFMAFPRFNVHHDPEFGILDFLDTFNQHSGQFRHLFLRLEDILNWDKSHRCPWSSYILLGGIVGRRMVAALNKLADRFGWWAQSCWLPHGELMPRPVFRQLHLALALGFIFAIFQLWNFVNFVLIVISSSVWLWMGWYWACVFYP